MFEKTNQKLTLLYLNAQKHTCAKQHVEHDKNPFQRLPRKTKSNPRPSGKRSKHKKQ